MNTQPLITTAAITSIVGAAIALLTAFGVPLTDQQQAAISGFVLVLAPWAVALIGQNTTTPLSKPRDTDGVELSRPGDKPALKELEAIQTEAIAINKEQTKAGGPA